MPATPRELKITQADIDRALRYGVPDAAPTADLHGVKFYAMDDLVNMPKPVWLITDMVEELGLTIFFGPDKAGKTIMLTSFLWAWASGADWWFDKHFSMRNPSDRPRSVLYVLLEGQGAFYSRYDAWRQANQFVDLLPNFTVVSQGVSIFEKNMNPQVEAKEVWPQAAQGLWEWMDEHRPAVLVIDTLSRATPGMDENSSEMANLVAWLDQARDAFGISTVVVHHTPLGDEGRPRGHSSLKGAASTYVNIRGDGAKRVAKMVVGPHRNSEGHNPHNGGDDWGWYFSKTSQYGSVVVAPAGKGEAAKEARPPKVLEAVLTDLQNSKSGAILATTLAEKYGKHVYAAVTNSPRLYKDGKWIKLMDSDAPEEL